MNRKQTEFVRCYTDIGKEWAGNATQSALKAGYSQRTAYSIGARLLKHAEIMDKIEQIESDRDKRYKVSKEDAIVEARKNYGEAKTDSMKKYWHDKWVKLQGWEVQKQEIIQDIHIEKQQDFIDNRIRNALKGN